VVVVSPVLAFIGHIPKFEERHEDIVTRLFIFSMGQGHSGWPKRSCRLRSIPSLKSLVESFLKLCDTSAFVGSPIGERISWSFEGYEGINEYEGKVLGEPLDEIESHNNVFIVLKEQPCDSNDEMKGHSQENSEFPEER